MKGHLPYYSNEVRERRGGPQGRGGLYSVTPCVKLKYKNATFAKIAQSAQRGYGLGTIGYSSIVKYYCFLGQ